MKTISLLATSLAVASLSLIGCATSGAPGTNSESSSSVMASSSSGVIESAGIRLEEPLPNSVVQSPLVVRGEAVGTWYFEASFPVKLLDANGNQLAIQPAQAQGEWMTEDHVPFMASLSFTAATPAGTLVLEKDNPSGLPENAGSISIPVRFTAE